MMISSSRQASRFMYHHHRLLASSPPSHPVYSAADSSSSSSNLCNIRDYNSWVVPGSSLIMMTTKRMMRWHIFKPASSRLPLSGWSGSGSGLGLGLGSSNSRRSLRTSSSAGTGKGSRIYNNSSNISVTSTSDDSNSSIKQSSGSGKYSSSSSSSSNNSSKPNSNSNSNSNSSKTSFTKPLNTKSDSITNSNSNNKSKNNININIKANSNSNSNSNINNIDSASRTVPRYPSSFSSTSSSSSSSRSSSSSSSSSNGGAGPDRPFSLPPGKFRPKQSLGQNFLSDQNYVLKIVDAMPPDKSEQGHKVVEIGPGAGALTRVLLPRYPMMTAIEIDQRAVGFLLRKLPTLNVVHQDVLIVDWSKIAKERGGRVNVIGNLPYYIVSQVLFSLADARSFIGTGTFTMQKEVATRIMSKPGTKAYGIPSVVFQLLSKPTWHFDIPPTVFYPVPKVDSALVSFDFTKQHESIRHVDEGCLRKVLLTTFNRRRKMIRQSFKDIAAKDEVVIPEKWSTKRPDELHPIQFVELTIAMYGTKEEVQKRRKETSSSVSLSSEEEENGSSIITGDAGASLYETIWRKNFYELLKETSLQEKAEGLIEVDSTNP